MVRYLFFASLAYPDIDGTDLDAVAHHRRLSKHADTHHEGGAQQTKTAQDVTDSMPRKHTTNANQGGQVSVKQPAGGGPRRIGLRVTTRTKARC